MLSSVSPNLSCKKCLCFMNSVKTCRCIPTKALNTLGGPLFLASVCTPRMWQPNMRSALQLMLSKAYACQICSRCLCCMQTGVVALLSACLLQQMQVHDLEQQRLPGLKTSQCYICLHGPCTSDIALPRRDIINQKQGCTTV